jgi:glycosyltransferase involved in cell wall biosynthesis
MKQKSLSVFFPAYNEEENIERAVAEAAEALEPLQIKYEIIIVNDGSTDDTAAIAERLSRINPHVRVIHHNPNQGYGAAVWSGIQAAQYEYTFFTDADLQFDLQEIKKLLAHAGEYSVVLGYRAKRQDPLIRLVNAKGWNILNRILFGLKVKDIDAAFKLFKTDLVQKLPIKSRGAMMSAELLIRLQRMGIIFKEVPVTHLPRLHGEATGAKPAVILRAFRELFSMYTGELGRGVTYLQVAMFGLIGVANTIIDVGSYTFLTRTFSLFALNVVATKIISFFFGTLFSFFMNRRWTFRRKERASLSEALRFYSTVGLGVVINAGAVYILHTRLGFYDLTAVGIATLITFAWGFLFSKFWVFRPSGKEEQSGTILASVSK